MLRSPSSRRLFALYAVATLLTAVLLAAVFLHHSRTRQRHLIRQRLASLYRLLASAHQAMDSDRFRDWLAQADFGPAADPAGNMAWITPPAALHWSLHPLPPGEFFPGYFDAIRAMPPAAAGAEPARLRFRDQGQLHLVHLQWLRPDQPDLGLLFLHAPLPPLFRGAGSLWIPAGLLTTLLLGLVMLFPFRVLRHLRNRWRPSGSAGVPGNNLPEGPSPGEPGPAVDGPSAFDALLNVLQDGILVLDAENRIQRANPAATALLDREPAELIGMAPDKATGIDGLADLIHSIREHQAPESAEFHMPALSGPVQVSGALPDPEASRLLLVLRDLSQLRRLETAGEEYATNVSHELKTPLTLILGYTETLLGHGDMDAEFRNRSLRTIERHTKRIIRIVDDLLRLAWLRNETASTRIPRAAVNVASVLDNAVVLSNEWAQNAGITVETCAPSDLVWPLNSGLIEEAIVNLVKNAILYALTGPVEVRARVLDNGHLEITVTDRGPGLKPEDAKHIFDRFYRVEKSRSRASGGSGLGLPIVQQIVEAHHGTARVDATLGEGCTFILEIPPLSAEA